MSAPWFEHPRFDALLMVHHANLANAKKALLSLGVDAKQVEVIMAQVRAHYFKALKTDGASLLDLNEAKNWPEVKSASDAPMYDRAAAAAAFSGVDQTQRIVATWQAAGLQVVSGLSDSDLSNTIEQVKELYKNDGVKAQVAELTQRLLGAPL